jgi:hypothetical protein
MMSFLMIIPLRIILRTVRIFHFLSPFGSLAIRRRYSLMLVLKCLFLFFCSPKRKETKEKGALRNAPTHILPTPAAQGHPPAQRKHYAHTNKKLSSYPFAV